MGFKLLGKSPLPSGVRLVGQRSGYVSTYKPNDTPAECLTLQAGSTTVEVYRYQHDNSSYVVKTGDYADNMTPAQLHEYLSRIAKG